MYEISYVGDRVRQIDKIELYLRVTVIRRE